MMNQNSIYYKQVQLLVEVLSKIKLDKYFALKGGTAINLFFRDMPRLSVDIDLMYLLVEPRDISLKNISDLFLEMANTIEDSIPLCKAHKLYQRDDGFLSKILIKKQNIQIKIEVSPVMRGTVNKPKIMRNSKEVQKHFGFVATNVVDIDDLFAGKICAALDRQHPRDFFDIKGLLDNEGISDSLMDTFIVYIISSNQPISKLLNPNRIDIENIYNEQFVGMTTTPFSLKTLLDAREELITTINKNLTNKHKEFLLDFKRGKPDWSLLPFENVKELPSVKWKELNLDKMTKAKRDEAVKKLEDVLLKKYK